jgi:hypothetical protein
MGLGGYLSQRLGTDTGSDFDSDSEWTSDVQLEHEEHGVEGDSVSSYGELEVDCMNLKIEASLTNRRK